MIGRLDRRRRAGAMTIAALLALAFLVATAPHKAASHPSADEGPRRLRVDVDGRPVDRTPFPPGL